MKHMTLSDWHWRMALADKRFREDLAAGIKAADEGRVSPWAEVKKRLGLLS